VTLQRRAFLAAAPLLLAATVRAQTRDVAAGKDSSPIAVHSAIAPMTNLVVAASMAAPLSAARASEETSPDAHLLDAPAAPLDLAGNLHSQAARTVAEWKASRAPNAAAEPSETASVLLPHESINFDGSAPQSDEVLALVGRLRIDSAAIGRAISDSRTLNEATLRLNGMGLFTLSQLHALGVAEVRERMLLQALWRRTAPFIAAPFPTDSSWGVPALKVATSRATYFVHGLNHGSFVVSHRGDVLRAVRKIAAEGHALYSEQNFPINYGYTYGRETRDHVISPAGQVLVQGAAQGFSAAAVRLTRILGDVLRGGGALLTGGWLALTPANPPASVLFLLFAASAAGLAAAPWVRRLAMLRRAAVNRRDGYFDDADHFEGLAKHTMTGKADLEALRTLELPGALRAEEDLWSRRSRAIADAVAEDAAARGSGEVHLIVGAAHAHETAWRLAHPEERRS
jgi:hypothetical protein